MNQVLCRHKIIKIVFLGLLLSSNIIIQNSIFSQVSDINDIDPHPKVISFNPDSIKYQELFNGDKDSVVFYSGVVTLIPGKTGKLHNTEIYEEMIIALEGEGELKIPKYKNLKIKFGNIALVPPNTDHQLINTGKKNFKYIYIATKKNRL
jgi:mannose-6-phosphate isomerase-like protein (cupin superfamily)